MKIYTNARSMQFSQSCVEILLLVVQNVHYLKLIFPNFVFWFIVENELQRALEQTVKSQWKLQTKSERAAAIAECR